MRSTFPLLLCQRNLMLIFAQYKTAKHEKTREFHLYCWDHVCKVNEWCLVDVFLRKFRVSTEIVVRDYCIVKCKNVLWNFRTAKSINTSYFPHAISTAIYTQHVKTFRKLEKLTALGIFFLHYLSAQCLHFYFFILVYLPLLLLWWWWLSWWCNIRFLVIRMNKSRRSKLFQEKDVPSLYDTR